MPLLAHSDRHSSTISHHLPERLDGLLDDRLGWFWLATWKVKREDINKKSHCEGKRIMAHEIELKSEADLVAVVGFSLCRGER